MRRLTQRGYRGIEGYRGVPHRYVRRGRVRTVLLSPRAGTRVKDPHWFACGHPRTEANTYYSEAPRSPVPGIRLALCAACDRERSGEYLRDHPEVFVRCYRKAQALFAAQDPSFTKPTEAQRRRFASQVYVGDGSGCWEWCGAYRFFSLRRLHLPPAVVAYLWSQGFPPKEGVVQRCGNRRCVRPSHLAPAPRARG